ncbi:Aminotransferase-like [Hirschfeldia incana]|nr:Aminotransferase-like [Hirschfeldia incana]
MDSRGSSDQDDEHIVHVRQALMCPDGGRFEGLRTAHFLNYTTTSIDDDVFELPLDAFVTSHHPEKLSFSGWGSPSVNWIEWVNTMAETNAVAWRRSGVHDAILASRYQIAKQDDLMTALVERWCIETNSFVFPWGEATVTLEDMIVLGGFSAIGNNVLASVRRDSMKSVEEKLKRAKREIEASSMVKRCCVGLWMKEMMNSGNEIEHEAFMVTWLSRFVFPNSGDLVKEKLFGAAVQLARGVRLALAPAVLAGIYSSLGVLKKQLVGGSGDEETVVTATSPFQFVQVWAWERILDVRPPCQPSQLKPHEPRLALWHHHGGGQEANMSHESIRTVLDSAKESFHYRPYTKPLKNFKFPKFYLEDDCWVSLEDEDIVAFGRCLRCSKLVGLNCIEPYYPHRVALQFGYDQDVPGVVPVVLTESPELAWKDYIRPITDEMIYIPSRLRQADVTVKYIRWWKQSVTTLQAMAKRSSTHKVLKEKPTETATMVKTSPPRTSKTANDKGTVSISAKSLTGSEKAKPLKKTELVKKPLSKLTKSSGRSVDEVKERKGVPKSSQEIKGHSHVIRPKALPVKSPRPQASKGPQDLSSSSVSPSLTSKKSTKISPKATTSHQSSISKATPALKKRNVADQRIKSHTKQDSSTETRLSSKGGDRAMMNTLKAMSEIMKLEEHVSEGGEVMYQIPKQQFEVLSQGVQDVLHELQSIKSALNIEKSSSL